MSADKAEYMPLRPTDDGPDSEMPSESHLPRRIIEYSNGRITIPPLLLWACLGAIGITMLNISLLPFTLSAVQRGLHDNKPFPTVYPDVYIGLDRAPGIAAKSKSISHTLPYARENGTLVQMTFNFPRTIARMNYSDPDVAYYDPSVERSTEVVVGALDATIMQFHIPDNGMTACAVTGFRPAEGVDMEGKVLDITGDISAIEVWNITTRDVLDPSQITWNHRPPRGNVIGQLDFSKGPNSTTPTFPCPLGQYQSVEFRCQKWQCLARFNETFTFPMLGFEIVQWSP